MVLIYVKPNLPVLSHFQWLWCGGGLGPHSCSEWPEFWYFEFLRSDEILEISKSVSNKQTNNQPTDPTTILTHRHRIDRTSRPAREATQLKKVTSLKENLQICVTNLL